MWRRRPIIRFIWAVIIPGQYLDKFSLPQKISFCKRTEARRDLSSPAEIAMSRYTLRTFGNKPEKLYIPESFKCGGFRRQSQQSFSEIPKKPVLLFATSLLLVGCWLVILVSELRVEHFNVCLYIHSDRAGLDWLLEFFCPVKLGI